MDSETRPPRKCMVEGCPRIHRALGYCFMHWKQVKRHGHPVRQNPGLSKGLRALGPMRGFASNMLEVSRELARAIGEVEAEIDAQMIESEGQNTMLQGALARMNRIHRSVEKYGEALKRVFGAHCDETGCPNPQARFSRHCVVHRARRYASTYVRRKKLAEMLARREGGKGWKMKNPEFIQEAV